MLYSILPYYLVPFLIYLIGVILALIYIKNVKIYVTILLVWLILFISCLTIVAWLKPWMN